MHVEEALRIHRALGDEWGIATSVFILGYVLANERDWAGAQPLFEESLRAFHGLGDDHYTLLASINLRGRAMSSVIANAQ